MPRYRYTALQDSGQAVRGELDAPNLLDLEARLQSQGLELIRVRKSWEIGTRKDLLSLSRRDIINFTFMLQQLVSSGVPLLDGLRDLRDTLDQRSMCDLTASLIASIENGTPLSAALARYPHLFSMYYISLIEAGERSGELDEVLLRLIDTLKWQDELIDKTRRLMFYPLLTGGVVFSVVIFILLYVVPDLARLIENMQQGIPWPTRVMLFLGDSLRKYWWLLLALLGLSGSALMLWARGTPEGRLASDRFILKIWRFGPTLKKLLLARFASTYGLLYRAGIPVLDSLDICSRLTRNRAMSIAITEARENVTEGLSLSESFARAEVFPPLVIRMLRIGEKTGNMERALENVSYFYQREVQDSIEKMQSMLQPILTAILGLILAVMMISVLWPMWDTLGKIKF